MLMNMQGLHVRQDVSEISIGNSAVCPLRNISNNTTCIRSIHVMKGSIKQFIRIYTLHVCQGIYFSMHFFMHIKQHMHIHSWTGIGSAWIHDHIHTYAHVSARTYVYTHHVHFGLPRDLSMLKHTKTHTHTHTHTHTQTAGSLRDRSKLHRYRSARWRA